WLWLRQQARHAIVSLRGHESCAAIRDLAPDGRFLITSDVLAKALVWDLDTGRASGRMGDDLPVVHAAFSADGRWVVADEQAGPAPDAPARWVTIGETATGRRLARFSPRLAGGTAVQWILSRDHRLAITWSAPGEPGSVEAWDLAADPSRPRRIDPDEV